MDIEQSVNFARKLQEVGADLIDASSGEIFCKLHTGWTGYQVPFAEKIKREAGIMTGAVASLHRLNRRNR